jgi:hypothetical protein
LTDCTDEGEKRKKKRRVLKRSDDAIEGRGNHRRLLHLINGVSTGIAGPSYYLGWFNVLLIAWRFWFSVRASETQGRRTGVVPG